MADKINGGGPAFPCEGGFDSGLRPYYGMSVRTWLVGKAIEGMLAGRKCELGDVNLHDMVDSAFTIADAVLARDGEAADEAPSGGRERAS